MSIFPPHFLDGGVGGAENLGTVCRLVQELGYQSVASVLDNDKAALAGQLAQEFPSYSFHCIPADDVRPKKARPPTEAKTGLLDESGILREDLRPQFLVVIEEVRAYLTQALRGGEIL